MNIAHKSARPLHLVIRLALSFFFLVLFSTISTAQVIVNVTNDNAIDVAKLDVQVENFNDIISFQLGFNWNPQQLEFLYIDNVNPEFLSFNFSEIGYLNIEPGKLRTLWSDASPTLDGKTLPDGAVLFSLYFDVKTLEDAEVYFGDHGPSFSNEIAVFTGPVTTELMSGFNYPDGIHIVGNVYKDGNMNCMNDGEIGYSEWQVEITGGGSTYYRLTDEDGNYKIGLDVGTYEVRGIPPLEYWTSCETSYTVLGTTTAQTYTQDIPMQVSIPCPYMTVDLGLTILRRCFENPMLIDYCNQGSAVATDSYVELNLNEFLSIENSTHPYTIENGLYLFDLGNVDEGECGTIHLTVLVDCDSTVVGQTHCSDVHIYPDDICLETSPDWSGASVKVEGECVGDEVHFRLSNDGTGNMTSPSTFIIIEDAVMKAPETFQLNSGQTHPLIILPANGTTYRVVAEQVQGHPGESNPSFAIEGCGTNSAGEFSTGFVTMFAEDDVSHFIDIDCRVNIGSYDPNDKQAFPRGYGESHNIEANTDLEYFIRFQNTGTDTAFNVIILDTISAHLDMSTIRPGVASHEYEVEIIDENILRFHFKNILLVDSTANEPASHGFVKFTIDQQANNEIGTVINNSAAIYFDFNPPVITNTVFHTIAEEILMVNVFEPNTTNQLGKAYPNPFRESVLFDFGEQSYDDLQFELYDLSGKKMRSEQHSGSQFTVKRGSLSEGMYFYNIRRDGQLLATGKLIVN